MGHSLMTQFEGLEFRAVTLPFVSSVDKAHEAVARINRAAAEEGVRPIIFSTLVQDELRDIVLTANGLFLDFFAAFVGPLERELNTRSTHRAGRAHGMADIAAYTTRINATNFALDERRWHRWRLRACRCDSRRSVALRQNSHVPVHGAAVRHLRGQLSAHRGGSRGGNTSGAPRAYRRKLYALTIKPERLQQIRNERRPDSRYASRQQVQYELRAAEAHVYALCDSMSRYDGMLHRGDREPHSQHHRDRAASAAVSRNCATLCTLRASTKLASITNACNCLTSQQSRNSRSGGLHSHLRAL